MRENDITVQGARRAARGWLLGIALLVLLPTRAALAQATETAPSPRTADDTSASEASRPISREERERAAKAAFDAGVAAAEAGDYARARSLFLRSRQLVVKASTLLNLAVADLKLGLVEEALFALDALESPSAGPEHERMRERARLLRDEAESLRHAESQEVAAEQLAPGQVQLEIPPAPHASNAAVPATAAASTRDTPASLAAPLAMLSVGGALLAGTIGAAIWWSDRSQAVDTCNQDPDAVCMQRTQIQRQEQAAMALTLTLGVTGLGLVTGGGVWLAQRKHDRPSPRVSAWASKHHAGLVAQFRF